MKLLGSLVVGFGALTLRWANFVECDLDLNDPAIVSRLPDECRNVDEATKALMLTEAASFKRFHQKLLEYEAGQAGPPNDDDIRMDMQLRSELYAAGNLHACLNDTQTLPAYIQCVIDRRAVMLDLLDQQTVPPVP